jgi:tetratricopeptide (TPR) repeat protein
MRTPVLAVSLLFATGCSSTTPTAGTRSDPIVVPEVRVTKTDPNDLPALFRAASDMLLREEYKPAAAEFDRIVAVDPNGVTAVPSLYNAGIAYHGLGDLDKAAIRYRASALQDPAAPTTKIAWLRLSRIYAHIERWKDLETVADVILARQDLTVLERIEGMGAKGLALVEQGRTEEAYDVIVKARNEIEDRKLGEAGIPSVELAQVSFALGEIRRVKSEKVKFMPVPADFGAVLEERCTGLLDAQAAYTDAMKSLDAHWSAMAGFRVGQLYQTLHRDVMIVPAPAGASALRQKQLWEGAMRMRYRILLEKGLAMMGGTVALGERTGESSAWVARAREAKKELETAIATEKEALSKLPFTEEEIKTALDDLKKKAPPKPKP